MLMQLLGHSKCLISVLLVLLVAMVLVVEVAPSPICKDRAILMPIPLEE